MKHLIFVARPTAASTLLLDLAETKRQDSTAVLDFREQDGRDLAEWLADLHGQANGSVVFWRGAVTTVLRAAVQHGVDFGPYFLPGRADRYLDVHAWFLRHLGEDLTWAQLYRWFGLRRSRKPCLAEQLRQDLLTLALAWTRVQLVEGKLDQRSRPNLIDLITSPYRSIARRPELRQLDAMVAKFLA